MGRMRHGYTEAGRLANPKHSESRRFIVTEGDLTILAKR